MESEHKTVCWIVGLALGSIVLITIVQLRKDWVAMENGYEQVREDGHTLWRKKVTDE